LTWYKKAAEQGNAKAMYKLGYMYSTGVGVKENYAQAYFWYNICIALGYEEPLLPVDICRSECMRHMTKSEIVKAQALARDWFEKHPQ